MAEATLALDFEGLMKLTAEAAGYGYRATTGDGLSSNAVIEIGLYVESGYRDFINAYDWSFTRPVTTSVLWSAASDAIADATATTIASTTDTFFPTMVGSTITFTVSGNTYLIDGYISSTIVSVTTSPVGEAALAAFTIATTGEYRLPDDFGGLAGDVYFAANDGRWLPIKQTGLADVLRLLQGSTSTSRPTHLAIQPLTMGTTTGQRFAFLVWRIPSSNYTIRYRYQVLPDKLSTGTYPYGGSQHAETIKFSCFAAMELSKLQGQNSYDAKYQQLLRQSIRRDKKFMTASEVGFNRHHGNVLFDRRARNITVGGVSYP